MASLPYGGDDAVARNEHHLVLDGFLLSALLAVGLDDHGSSGYTASLSSLRGKIALRNPEKLDYLRVFCGDSLKRGIILSI